MGGSGCHRRNAEFVFTQMRRAFSVLGFGKSDSCIFAAGLSRNLLAMMQSAGLPLQQQQEQHEESKPARVSCTSKLDSLWFCYCESLSLDTQPRRLGCNKI